MKQEEKAKAYDEALEKAKEILEMTSDKSAIYTIFPELVESEDEKIRKELITFFQRFPYTNLYDAGLNAKDVLAWLEKQGDYANFRDKAQVGDRITKNEAGVLVNLSQLKRVAKPSEKQGEKHSDPYNGISFKYNGHIWGMCARDNGVDISCDNHLIKHLEEQAEVKESTIFQHENRTCEGNGNSLTYEDEKIRKEIINYFRCQSEEEPTRKEIHNKWIAWLENIPVTIDHEKREGFRLGYKACHEKQGEQTHANWSEDEKVRKELIKHLKEGAEGYEPAGDSSDYQRWLAWVEKQGEPIDKIVKRAMNEKQRVLLTETNGDANIDWDTRSLQDVKLLLEYGLDYIKKLEKQGEQEPEENKGNIGGISANPEWSEEDEINVYNIIHFLEEPSMLENNEPCKKIVIDWLKSLKGRVQPQPKQEWNEEDEEILRTILSDGIRGAGLDMLQVNWLKSLRPQNRWKPSEAQMDSITCAVRKMKESACYDSELISLFNDLKKLKDK